MPEFALINMNGRMYDPLLGRMLAPDNFVHGGSQGYNRFSYALNNPMSYVDPDGNNPILIAIAVGAVTGAITGGVHAAHSKSGDWYNGVWKGALVGAVGGAFSAIGGGGTFWNNLYGAQQRGQ